jgi:hypothetical protein
MLFDPRVVRVVFSALKTILFGAVHKNILDRRLVRIGQCQAGLRWIPCLKEHRTETRCFGLLTRRTSRVLIAVDGYLHLGPNDRSRPRRYIRIVIFDPRLEELAKRELSSVAALIDAVPQYRHI